MRYWSLVRVEYSIPSNYRIFDLNSSRTTMAPSKKTPKGILPSYHLMSERQRREFKNTIHHKRSVIERVSAKKMTVTKAAAELGVWPRSIRRMCSTTNQQRLTAFSGIPKRVRIRLGKWNSMEDILYKWIVTVNLHFRHVKAGCSMAVFCTKAAELAKSIGIMEFQPTNGWFGRFCCRYDLIR